MAATQSPYDTYTSNLPSAEHLPSPRPTHHHPRRNPRHPRDLLRPQTRRDHPARNIPSKSSTQPKSILHSIHSSPDLTTTPSAAAPSSIRPYPCIGLGAFLNLNLSQNPSYPSIPSRLRSPSSPTTYLEVGCCFGQDLRKLLHDGVTPSPTHKLHALDVESLFFDLGRELWRDGSRLPADTFLEADLAGPTLPTACEGLRGSVGVIGANMVFHLFDWERQKLMARNLVELGSGVPGSVIVGSDNGVEEAVGRQGVKEDAEVFFHNPESWARLWAEVGEETGTRWKVDAVRKSWAEVREARENLPMAGTDTFRLMYTITRL